MDDLNSNDMPTWWSQNQILKQKMGLPAYEPPRFSDGHYLHEIVPEVEEAYDCTIQFVGVDAHYSDDWQVWIEGSFQFSISRHRDKKGNTVYEMAVDEFKSQLASAIN